MTWLSVIALLCWVQFVAPKPPANPVQIVLAHCNESLAWVEELGYGSITTVYDKCGNSDGPGNHVLAPNVGRESGTYLQHIVDNFDSLADWTVFSQAQAPTYGYRGHRRGGGHLMQNSRFSDYVDAAMTRKAYPRYFIFTGILSLKEGSVYHCIRRGYGAAPSSAISDQDMEEKICGISDEWEQWYEFPPWFSIMVQDLQHEQQAPLSGVEQDGIFRLFDIQAEEGLLFFVQGARFALSREAIHARPKAYYEGLLRYLQHPDPWAGYFLEWLWWYVMGGDPAPCGFEAQAAEDFAAWLSQDDSRRMVTQQFSGSGVSGSDDNECKWADWQTWQCSKFCGNGTLSRVRHREEEGNGTCVGSSEEVGGIPCNTESCEDAAFEPSCQLQYGLSNPFISILPTLSIQQLEGIYVSGEDHLVCEAQNMTTYFTTCVHTENSTLYSYPLSTNMTLTVVDWGNDTRYAVVTVHSISVHNTNLPIPDGVVGQILFAFSIVRSTGSLNGTEAASANDQPLVFRVTTGAIALGQVVIYSPGYPKGQLLEVAGGSVEFGQNVREVIDSLVYLPHTSTIVGFGGATNATHNTTDGASKDAGGSDSALYALLALLLILLVGCFAAALYVRKVRTQAKADRMELEPFGTFPRKAIDPTPADGDCEADGRGYLSPSLGGASPSKRHPGALSPGSDWQPGSVNSYVKDVAYMASELYDTALSASPSGSDDIDLTLRTVVGQRSAAAYTMVPGVQSWAKDDPHRWGSPGPSDAYAYLASELYDTALPVSPGGSEDFALGSIWVHQSPTLQAPNLRAPEESDKMATQSLRIRGSVCSYAEDAAYMASELYDTAPSVSPGGSEDLTVGSMWVHQAPALQAPNLRAPDETEDATLTTQSLAIPVSAYSYAEDTAYMASELYDTAPSVSPGGSDDHPLASMWVFQAPARQAPNLRAPVGMEDVALTTRPLALPGSVCSYAEDAAYMASELYDIAPSVSPVGSDDLMLSSLWAPGRALHPRREPAMNAPSLRAPVETGDAALPMQSLRTRGSVCSYAEDTAYMASELYDTAPSVSPGGSEDLTVGSMWVHQAPALQAPNLRAPVEPDNLALPMPSVAVPGSAYSYAEDAAYMASELCDTGRSASPAGSEDPTMASMWAPRRALPTHKAPALQAPNLRAPEEVAEGALTAQSLTVPGSAYSYAEDAAYMASDLIDDTARSISPEGSEVWDLEDAAP